MDTQSRELRNADTYGKQLIAAAGPNVTSHGERLEVITRAMEAFATPGDHDRLVVSFGETLAALRDVVPAFLGEQQLNQLLPLSKVIVENNGQVTRYVKTWEGLWLEHAGHKTFSAGTLTALGQVTLLQPGS